MDWKIAVAMVAAALMFVLRLYSLRRVAAGQGRFVWLMCAPQLFWAGVILWAGLHFLAAEPVAGVGMLVVGGIYAVILVRFLTRLARSVKPAGADGDRAAAVMEPVVDFTVTMVGLMLIGGLVAVVALIVWGVSQSAH
jgi:uncharacterized protein involved in response to NO